MKKLFAGVASVMLAATCATPALAASSVKIKQDGANNAYVSIVNGEYITMGVDQDGIAVMRGCTDNAIKKITGNIEKSFDGVETSGAVLMDGNIAFNNTIVSNSKVELLGNVNQAGNIKAEGNIVLAQGAKNFQEDEVIYSANGDIYVYDDSNNLSGLLYAPHGTVHFFGKYNNLNNAVVIAEDVEFADAEQTINNVNASQKWSNFVRASINA